jgi:hypothetical protein
VQYCSAQARPGHDFCELHLCELILKVTEAHELIQALGLEVR